MSGASAVIVAAGRGARFGGDKLARPLHGRPVLHWTLAAFESCPAIESITLVVSEENREAAAVLIAAAGCRRVAAIVPGGAERQESVFRGLQAAPPSDLVAVHDGARPLVTPALIARCVEAAREHGAATPALPVVDTLKRLDAEGQMRETVERRSLVAIQTPQVFRRDLLLEAHQSAARDGFTGTDDASLVERLGHPVFPVPGDPRNLKITTPADLALAEALLTHSLPHPPRIGFGYDVHRLVPGRPLVLGGVVIPHPLGLEGHSDADVLSHAIGDALLGAAGLGDLGRHFPDTDARWKDASSLDLLCRIVAQLREAGLRPFQVDAMLLAEAPRIAPHVTAMVGLISAALSLAPDAVNIKATTCEGMGFVGRREGMAAHAVATVVSAVHDPPAGLSPGRED
jgi:2-C-methyl-D-erythritol 4-phosphate cytidylyltransferase/2-C-methyl-D-erythritol 2,4-cyclodiphosphate synthase